MYRQALQLFQTVLGKEHPDTLRSMNGLASSLRDQGKHADAEAAANAPRAIKTENRTGCVGSVITFLVFRVSSLWR
jgi:hypothetical protein